MKTLEPRQVSPAETLIWLKEAFELISRRLLVFVFSVVIFIVLIYLAIRAFVTVIPHLPSTVSLSFFLIYFAFILFVVLADMVVLAFLSDRSQPASPGQRIQALMPEQKTLLRLSFMALLVGATIWIGFLSVNPQKDFAQSCDVLIGMLMTDKDNPLLFIFQVTAAVLYFLVLALVGLRTFFSIPLVIFHDLSYREAQYLSQKAIYLNIRAMSFALVMWIILFMVAMSAVNVLSLILFPLFAAYIYVSYRHIFIGQLENDKAKVIAGNSVVREAYSEK